MLTDNKAAVKLYEELGFRISRHGMVKPLKH
jgi:ribosomal protein S18 acetylase RimI-like enzyme